IGTAPAAGSSAARSTILTASISRLPRISISCSGDPERSSPGLRHGLIGDNEFAGKVFGQAFEAARGVDGIADRGDRGGIAIAHLSDNGRPAMNADTDTHRPIEFAPQRSVQFVEARGNKTGRGERLSAAGMGAALDPE